MSSTSSSSDGERRNRPPTIEVDAAMIARALGLAPDAFRRLMEHGHIRTLSERGLGVDEGRYRLSFYYRDKRLRIVTDGEGRVVAREERAPRPRSSPRHAVLHATAPDPSDASSEHGVSSPDPSSAQ